MNTDELNGVLRHLVDGLCERKALKPLSILLPAYMGLNGLTDGWQELYDALRDARALAKDSFEPGELEQLKTAISLTSKLLH